MICPFISAHIHSSHEQIKCPFASFIWHQNTRVILAEYIQTIYVKDKMREHGIWNHKAICHLQKEVKDRQSDWS